MRIVRGLLLGSAASLIAVVGTQAAELDYGRDGDGFTLHDARATYITNILRGDRERGISPVSIGTAMKLSGHRTLAAFQKYVRMVEEDVVNAVAMSQSLAELHMILPATRGINDSNNQENRATQRAH